MKFGLSQVFRSSASFLLPRKNYLNYTGAWNRSIHSTATRMNEVDVDGANVLAKALKDQGIEFVFGVVGFPVIETAFVFQQHGLKFIGMRNEQAAAYAAQATGYLTRTPGVCLTVGGPGVLHTIGGLANAESNCWPMVLIGGACERYQEEMGAFQETKQVDATRLFTKFSARPSNVQRIPYYVQKAIRMATYGRPGASYLDFPGDLLNECVPEKTVEQVSKLLPPPESLAPQEQVEKAVELLKSAKNPLVVVGKGAAYGRAERNVNELIERTKLPFLPTPMGKGVVPDDHPNCVSPARSLALQKADVVLLLGARINWMLHFGQPPRFSPDVKIIQVDVEPEEFQQCVNTTIPLLGDINQITGQLLNAASQKKLVYPSDTPWWKSIGDKIELNRKTVTAMMADTSLPLNYYAAISTVQKLIPKDSIIVNEGANTMDIGRTVLLNGKPRCRLDAGTYGTMGLGMGFAISAALHCQSEGKGQRVVCVQGDSAFGFGGMEVETCLRYKLPVIVVIINNGGIYGGVEKETWDELVKDKKHLGFVLPPTSLTQNCHYEKLVELAGGKGFFCSTIDQLQDAIKQAIDEKEKPTIINLMIAPSAQRKQQDFEWLTRAKV